MNRFVKSSVLAAAVTATTLVPTLDASAGQRWREHRPHHPGIHHRQDQRGDLLAAGILGLAVGAIAAGALSRQGNAYAGHAGTDYFPPAPRHYREPRYTYSADLEPWSQEWYRYCSMRYRSFDARTGTFRGYDGRDHFCVAN